MSLFSSMQGNTPILNVHHTKEFRHRVSEKRAKLSEQERKERVEKYRQKVEQGLPLFDAA